MSERKGIFELFEEYEAELRAEYERSLTDPAEIEKEAKRLASDKARWAEEDAKLEASDKADNEEDESDESDEDSEEDGEE